MEPAPEERDDYSTLINIFQVWLAAMEPAPEERDDRLRGVIRVQRDTGAAMEPAPEERDDLGVACRNFAPLTAAMEPAPEERDDFGSQAVPGYDRPAAMEPAPEERDDLAGGLRRYSAMLSPQWSPLRRSGTTGPFNGYVWFVIKPQWSPLRRSGTTHVQRRQHEAVIAAAMEPAPEERDDADPAVRRLGPGGRAAMEPAPEERDDSPSARGCQPRSSSPQWSPLRRSGTTVAQPVPEPGEDAAAMEPAPEERDDVPGHQRPAARRRRAAMEPAPEERDDRLVHLDRRRRADGRNGARSGGAGRRRQAPSRERRHRSSRNGARSGGAGRRAQRHRLVGGVRDSRNGARSGGAGRPGHTGRPRHWSCAAMEPAPEERDDRQRHRRRVRRRHAAMEPAPEERDDPRGRPGQESGLHAAMEPAPEERDDLYGGTRVLTADPPQWSPLRRSGTTRYAP